MPNSPLSRPNEAWRLASRRERRTYLLVISGMVGLGLLGGVSRSAKAQTPPPTPSAASVSEDSVSQIESLALMLTRLAIPDEYQNTKDWGKTREIPRGLRISTRDGRLRIRRRDKEVNHGSWTHYRVVLADPRQLRMNLDQLQRSEDGRYRFRFLAEAPLKAHARQSQWQWGVQLWSLSADADARVRLVADCEVGLVINPSHVPPTVSLAPRVLQARVELIDFDLQRLSNLRGEAAEVLGDGLERVLRKELERRSPELTDRLNRQLEKNQDKLKLSLHDLAKSKWNWLLHGQP